jgi:hypothetical protein
VGGEGVNSLGREVSPGRSLNRVSASKDPDLLRLDLIDEPMLLVDPPRPAPGEFVPQRFGPADPFKWIALFPDQANHTKRLRAVLLHPPSEIIEAGRVKFQASQ